MASIQTALLSLSLVCSFGVASAQKCDMAGAWVLEAHVLNQELHYATDNPDGTFNVTFDLRHGPGVETGRILSNGTIRLDFQDGKHDTCFGQFVNSCNAINWTESCLADSWCRAYTDGCLSPPPPYGDGFSFHETFGSNMVLQQAPAKAAVYGIVVGKPSKVTVTVEGEGTSYTVDATFNATHQTTGPEFVGGNYPPPFATWKAYLKPTAMGGNYTVIAQCTGCTEDGSYSLVNITNVTFGDVWHCSGQSNMWLPVDNAFERNHTLSNITAGKYHNIRIMAGNSGNGPTNPWKTAVQAATELQGGRGAMPPLLWSFGAACWYFAQTLTDSFEKAGKTAPPLGMQDTAIGGQRIEEYMMNNTEFYTCQNRSGATAPEWNGRLFGSMIIPFVDQTVKGWVWYQGENNMGEVKGNSMAKMGYSCEQQLLVKQWREIWSEEPGTTDPMAPFGIVTLASSGSEGGPHMGTMRYAQTASYGVLPNPAMPNTFFAQAYDLDDEWGPSAGPCFDEWKCCVQKKGLSSSRSSHYYAPPPPVPASCNSTVQKLCTNACAQANVPVAMSGIHPRSKYPVGHRLSTAAYNTVYGGTAAYTGPTLSGCSVSSQQLEVRFNSSLLRGDSVDVRDFVSAGGSQLYVQANASEFCMESFKKTLVNSTTGKPYDVPYCPRWAGGSGELSPGVSFDDGWIQLNYTKGSDSSSIIVDLTPLNGTQPTAVRYAWGIVNCCNTQDPMLYITHGCVANCPIVSSSMLPANPFQAKIVSGKCECVAPQVCSE